MTVRSVLIVADDLTGACDTAGALAARTGTVRVELGGAGTWAPVGAPAAPVVAVDVDARAASAAVAVRSTIQAMSFASGDVYLKIDSTLRGHVLATVTAAVDAFRARHPRCRVVVCPAFPVRGRTVRDRRVLVDGTPVGSRVLDALAAIPGVEVPDAASDDDLRAVVGVERSVPTLWVGSAGLAAQVASVDPAGASTVGEALAPGSGSVAIVVGTTDALTVRAAAELHGRVDPRVRVLSGDPRQAPFQHDAVALARDAAALVLTGGYTARRVLEGLGIRALDVHGELEPGVPWATVPGATTVVVTKAGGFGDAGTLGRLTDRLTSRPAG